MVCPTVHSNGNAMDFRNNRSICQKEKTFLGERHHTRSCRVVLCRLSVSVIRDVWPSLANACASQTTNICILSDCVTYLNYFCARVCTSYMPVIWRRRHWTGIIGKKRISYVNWRHKSFASKRSRPNAGQKMMARFHSFTHMRSKILFFGLCSVCISVCGLIRLAVDPIVEKAFFNCLLIEL